METRRFTLTISGVRGRPREGEVVLARRWQPELDRLKSAFLIVLLEEPSPVTPRVVSAGVAVCVPERPLDTPFALREPAPSYRVTGSRSDRRPAATFPPFSESDMSSYARGRIVAATPLGLRADQVFSTRRAAPRLELLARALAERSGAPPAQEAETPFLTALASSMAVPGSPGIEAVDATMALTKLRELIGKAERGLSKRRLEAPSAAHRVVERVRTLVEADSGERALAEAQALYPEPLALAEDVLFCRCLAKDAESALELAAMRAYLEAAVVPESAGELAMDRTVTLEQLSSAALFMEPHRLEGMRATFEYFQKRFGAAYREHHRRYWEGCERLRQELEEAEATARALARLNSLRELGKAVGLNALAQYDDLGTAMERCPLVETLAESLGQRPSCPLCGITLADEAPGEQVRDVVRRLQRALRQQQNRLSSQAIRHILSRQRGERIEQFLQVVQASDLQGLAEVLDDDLVAFLRALLTTGAGAPTPLLERLRQAYPTVSEESLEAAVEEFRRLLEEALAAERRAGRRARVRLGEAKARARRE